MLLLVQEYKLHFLKSLLGSQEGEIPPGKQLVGDSEK